MNTIDIDTTEQEAAGVFVRSRGAGPIPMAGESLWFVMSGARLILRRQDDGVAILRATSRDDLGLTIVDPLYIGALDGVPCMAARFEGDSVPEQYTTRDLRALWSHVPDVVWSIAGLASELLHWAETTRYCPRCGHVPEVKETEWGATCPNCGLTQYPRVSPCTITLIHDDEDRLLLTRQSSWPNGFYSLVAGFVESGETLEECVVREVREETGVEIDEIAYEGSQPWPFPHQLMVGFTARYAGGEIVVDHSELEDARWFTLADLPTRPPGVSIAGKMIEAFVAAHSKDALER